MIRMPFKKVLLTGTVQSSYPTSPDGSLRYIQTLRFPDVSDEGYSLSHPNTKNSRRSFLYSGHVLSLRWNQFEEEVIEWLQEAKIAFA